MPRMFQVGFAIAEVEGLFAADARSFADALRESWKAGGSVTRYGRTWRISKILSSEDGGWQGRIGFIKEGDIVTYGWDPKSQDFRTAQASGGVVVPFVVDPDSGLVAFQLRSGVVRPTTFTGALRAMFNSSEVYRWRIDPLVRELSFESWRTGVERVTEARFRLERPNPDWVDREEVEHIIEDLDAEVSRLTARAREGHGLNTEGALFRQALDHTLRDYGRSVVRGEDPRGNELQWDSSGGGTAPVKGEVQSETEADEVPLDDLDAALRREASQLSDARPQEADDGEEE